ncbi:HofP DNA utilization family protein [Superficieibacter sp. BNK-5]|uniref:HofP DNA utilization family protein n=1 Tax=Superficieibacter sp. BNK-5 TaxID=3376142 RepID=UPI0039BFD21C
MRAKHGILLLITLPMIVGMRDPFQPPEDRCQTAQLAQWRYQGTIDHPPRRIGIVRDAQGKWRRVEMGSQLPAGWRVIQLTSQTLEIETGAGCDPAHWSWSRKGEQHENRDKHSAADVNAGGVGAKNAASLAGSR